MQPGLMAACVFRGRDGELVRRAGVMAVVLEGGEVSAGDPIAVVLYTGEQFRDITRAPSWAAGAYDGVIRVPMRGALDKREELDRVLSHEFTHALIRTLASRGVPAWRTSSWGSVTRSRSIPGSRTASSWSSRRLS